MHGYAGMIRLSGHSIGDQELKHAVKRETHKAPVWCVELDDTMVTVHGCEWLAGIESLKEVSISSPNCTDEMLSALLQASALSSLFLYYAPRITDCGLANIGRAPQLRELYLQHTGISDAALKWISQLACLWSLVLSHTRVSDTGIEYLSACGGLRLLKLDGTKIMGSSLAGLPNNRFLGLYLDHTAINDERIETAVYALTEIKDLTLSYTSITSRCGAALGQLQYLNALRVDGTHIDDQFLCDIEQAPQLQYLSVFSTGVTAQGVTQLRIQRPSLRVSIEPIP